MVDLLVMTSSFIPRISKIHWDSIVFQGDNAAIFELLVQPLHEELYKRNDFAFLNDLSPMQQLYLSFDYLRAQAGQGGFIQFLVNGYAPLLLNMPEWLKQLEAHDMALLIDDVLRVYVLNNEYFKQEISVADFGKLYEELQEFELLDKRYEEQLVPTLHRMVEYAIGHIEEFAELV